MGSIYINRIGSIEGVKGNKKVLHHFAIFAIINELVSNVFYIFLYCRV